MSFQIMVDHMEQWTTFSLFSSYAAIWTTECTRRWETATSLSTPEVQVKQKAIIIWLGILSIYIGIEWYDRELSIFEHIIDKAVKWNRVIHQVREFFCWFYELHFSISTVLIRYYDYHPVTKSPKIGCCDYFSNVPNIHLDL